MTTTLPQIHLGTLQVSRLIAGSNPISGFSHAGSERTRQMLEYFTVDRIKAHLRDCEAHGINALVARADRFIMRVLAEYWREGGRIQWIAQTAPEMRDPQANIQQARQAGASAIFVHGGDVDQLFAQGQSDEVHARVKLIRSLGLPAGMAAHDPCNLLEAQEKEIPVDFYLVCLYNLTGYRGRTTLEPKEEFERKDRAIALAALRQLERPCIAYKVLGAARLSPEEGLADVRQALRPGDGVLIGMFPPDHPDIIGENVRRIATLTV
ncbi:MAG TPA: hypothetical protein VFA07_04490 [Chthonomonadaceae bacterium]|nr:hypothetical protein [Chthonomonadaceae bacterium]